MYSARDDLFWKISSFSQAQLLPPGAAVAECSLLQSPEPDFFALKWVCLLHCSVSCVSDEYSLYLFASLSLPWCLYHDSDSSGNGKCWRYWEGLTFHHLQIPFLSHHHNSQWSPFLAGTGSRSECTSIAVLMLVCGSDWEKLSHHFLRWWHSVERGVNNWFQWEELTVKKVIDYWGLLTSLDSKHTSLEKELF